MNGFGVFKENNDVNDLNQDNYSEISLEAQQKFDKLMEDDKISENMKTDDQKEGSTLSEIKDKFDKLFDVGDFFETYQKEQVENNEQEFVSSNESDDSNLSNSMESDYFNQVDLSQKREANSTYELNGDAYETDENGDTYKRNKELLPNTEYTVNGNIYKTDENGNKVSCYSEPKYTEEGIRNNKEQKESGGDERQEDDDGGHIIAKILGGSEGEENLVAMRRTINRGDYKKMENEIAKALQEGKKVIVKIDLKYDEDSHRPSKMIAEYTIDDKKTVVEFDNEVASTDLIDSLDDKISNEDYDNLKDEIEDMKADGTDATITSVKAEYDEDGDCKKVTVGILDESTGEKSYKVYSAR